MKSRLVTRSASFRLAVFATLATLSVTCSQLALAQTPVGQFIDEQGLTDTNLGRSANAVQRTCGQLIATGRNITGGTEPENELWRRCNELVITARDLNAGMPTGGRTLGYSDSDELLAAFQQVNGEELQASANISQSASYDQFSGIAGRLAALRGAGSSSITSVAATGAEFMYGSGGGAAADSDAPFGPWGWFIRGTFATGDRDVDNPNGFANEEDGFEFDQYGVTVGIDYVSGSSVWGFALAFNSYEIEMKDVATTANTQTAIVSGGDIESDSVNGTLFYDITTQSNIYFTALAGFGSQSVDMARNFIYFSQNAADSTVVDQTRVLTGDPDGDSFAGSLTLGRAIVRGGMIIDPYIGVTFDRVTIDGFAERDSGNVGAGLGGMQLAFDEQEIDSLRAKLGVQISNNVNTDFGSIRPMFSAEWFHEFEDDPRVIRVKYALEDELATTSNPGSFTTGFGNCVSCFDLISEAPDSDYFVLGAGIAATTQRGFQAFLMLEGLLGYQNLDAFAVTVGFRGQF